MARNKKRMHYYTTHPNFVAQIRAYLASLRMPCVFEENGYMSMKTAQPKITITKRGKEGKLKAILFYLKNTKTISFHPGNSYLPKH